MFKYVRTMLAVAAVVAVASPAMASPPPTCTKSKVTVALSDSPILLDGSVTVTGTVVTNGGSPTPITIGTITIFYRKTGGGPPNWQVLAAGTPDSNGQISAVFTASSADWAVGDTAQFETIYDGVAPYCSDQHSPKVTAQIVESCQGLQLTNNLASGPGEPPPGTTAQDWTFRVNIKNCTGFDLTNVKLQGGTNGWTSFVSTSQGAAKYNNKNQVITWTTDVLDGQSKFVDVTVNGSIKSNTPCWDGVSDDSAFIRWLSGAWSAAYIDPDPLSLTYGQSVKTAITDGEDPLNPYYTKRASVVVTCQ